MSRDVTDSGSDTFSWSTNGCSIAIVKLYCRNWLFVVENFYDRYVWRGIPLRYSLNSLNGFALLMIFFLEKNVAVNNIPAWRNFTANGFHSCRMNAVMKLLICI